MGNNQSTNVNRLTNEIDKILDEYCFVLKSSPSKLKGNKIFYENGKTCPDLSFLNNYRQNSKCNEKELAKILIKYIKKLTAREKKVLNLNLFPKDNYNINFVRNYLIKKCGTPNRAKNEMSNNSIDIWNKNQCKLVKRINNYDTTKSCIIKQINDAITELEKEKYKSRNGVTRTTFLGFILILLFILLVIIIIIVLINK